MFCTDNKNFQSGHFGIFAPRWQQKINCQHDEVGWHGSQGVPGEEPAEFDGLIARERREQWPPIK
jgi:hypothetical protein